MKKLGGQRSGCTIIKLLPFVSWKSDCNTHCVKSAVQCVCAGYKEYIHTFRVIGVLTGGSRPSLIFPMVQVYPSRYCGKILGRNLANFKT